MTNHAIVDVKYGGKVYNIEIQHDSDIEQIIGEFMKNNKVPEKFRQPLLSRFFKTQDVIKKQYLEDYNSNPYISLPDSPQKQGIESPLPLPCPIIPQQDQKDSKAPQTNIFTVPQAKSPPISQQHVLESPELPNQMQQMLNTATQEEYKCGSAFRKHVALQHQLIESPDDNKSSRQVKIAQADWNDAGDVYGQLQDDGDKDHNVQQCALSGTALTSTNNPIVKQQQLIQRLSKPKERHSPVLKRERDEITCPETTQYEPMSAVSRYLTQNYDAMENLRNQAQKQADNRTVALLKTTRSRSVVVHLTKKMRPEQQIKWLEEFENRIKKPVDEEFAAKDLKLKKTDQGRLEWKNEQAELTFRPKISEQSRKIAAIVSTGGFSSGQLLRTDRRYDEQMRQKTGRIYVKKQEEFKPVLVAKQGRDWSQDIIKGLFI